MLPGGERVLAASLAEIWQLLLAANASQSLFFTAEASRNIPEEVTLVYDNKHIKW